MVPATRSMWVILLSFPSFLCEVGIILRVWDRPEFCHCLLLCVQHWGTTAQTVQWVGSTCPSGFTSIISMWRYRDDSTVPMTWVSAGLQAYFLKGLHSQIIATCSCFHRKELFSPDLDQIVSRPAPTSLCVSTALRLVRVIEVNCILPAWRLFLRFYPTLSLEPTPNAR